MTAPTTAPGKESEAIRGMFADVAPRYDFLNHLLSGSLDHLWRRRATRALGDEAAGRVLDLCCGTGDQAISLARRGHEVFAADFCVPMLAIARAKYEARDGRRPSGLAADSLVLPFSDKAFAAVTVSFGLRNVADLDGALVEIARILEPGGRLVVLEFALPRSAAVRSTYQFYFRHILPRIGRLFSASEGAYQYLPDSVQAFPQRQAFNDRMRAAGFAEVDWRDLSGGTVCLYTGRTPA